MSHTIDLYGEGVQHEAAADAAILPGALVERTATGVANHATAGGGGNSHFALEYSLTGGDVDDAYAAGDNVLFKTVQAGGAVSARIGAAVAKGDKLASKGDGTLIKAVAGDVAVAEALEAATSERAPVEVTFPITIA